VKVSVNVIVLAGCCAHSADASAASAVIRAYFQVALALALGEFNISRPATRLTGTSAWPAFFIAPAMNPRTVCFCHPMLCMVARPGLRSFVACLFQRLPGHSIRYDHGELFCNFEGRPIVGGPSPVRIEVALLDRRPEADGARASSPRRRRARLKDP